MSKTIDQKVVEMQFDNRNFERNVSTTMSTVEKLKSKLNFTDAAKGLENVSSAAKKVDMGGLAAGVEVVHAKFSALQAMGITALVNITNSAVNAGKRIVSALTVDPIKTGFQEYETQINAVQTILANTQSKGSTLSDVNAALDELNKYADQTIYNFTEMTKNIGTFTAAGVDLDKSVQSIKGIANLAAVSGSTSLQASTAMYQLSQALSAGKVSLQDWNSVVNAGMGGEVFQNALIRTARQMGTGVDEAIKKYGTFRESLTKGQWLTAEVLTETLAQISGAYTEADLVAQGYSQDQAKAIVELANTAVGAATDVKTFTQLWDTLKEAAQSGWTESWEILVGDFEEAKGLLGELYTTFSEIIGQSAEARNALLYDAMTSNWKKITDGITEAGLSAEDFKDKVTEVAKSKGMNIEEIVSDYGSLEAAFKNGALSSDLLNEALTKMTGTSSEISKKMEDLRGKYKTNEDILKALNKAGYENADIQDLIGKSAQGQTIALNDLSDAQLMSIGYTADQVKEIRKLSEYAELAGGSMQEFIDNVAVPQGRELLIDTLRVSLRSLISIFERVGAAWRDVFPPTTSDQLLGIIQSVRDFALSLRPSEETLQKFQSTFRGLFSILSIGKQALSAILSPIGTLLGRFADLSGGILDTTASFGDWLFELNNTIKTTGSFKVVGDIFSDVVNTIFNGIESIAQKIGGIGGIFSGITTAVSTVFNAVKTVVGDVFNWIRDNVTAGDIFAGLAGGGVFILFKKFSGLIEKVKELFEGFGDSVNSGGFSDILGSIHDSLESFQQGIQAASLVGIATAVALLSSSMRKISEIEPVKIAYSLVAIRLMIASLTSGFKSLSKTISKFNSKGTVTASITLIGIATAVNILASAMQKMQDLEWDEIAKGLVAIGASIGALSGALRIIGKSSVTLRTSVAIIALAEACKMLADALLKFGSMSWDTIARGLTSMGFALGELTAVMAVLSKVGGGKSLLGATSILIAVQSLDEISENLKRLGALSWDEIGRGLSAMGGALVEFTAVLAVLSKVGGFGALLGGTAILIAVQSLDEISENLKRLGALSWDEIGRGLAAMGGALSEIGLITGALGKLAGFSGILGAGAILIVVQGLHDIADALMKFGSMAWDEIGRGLSAMGGALAEIGVISGFLGKLTGFSGLIGAGTILLTIQGLGDLADALAKFGSMSWDEIGRGLAGMGGALAELAIISGLTGTLTGIAGLVGAGTITLASQGLDKLATAFQKFGSMSWDEIGRGLSAMGAAMGETALGGLLNTFSGFGAAAISEMAEPLGLLADSIKKWEGVTVPEGLGVQLGSLADGVSAFNFAGWGADAIAAVASPIGTMAESISKWSGVSIPETLGNQLISLSTGVSSFNFAGWGADAIAAVAPALGSLADSMTKWTTVTIPDGLGTDLESLAGGVNAFSFAFVGGWSISSLVGPLGDLADVVAKWNGVTIPTNIGTGLQDLADGVGAFNFSFFSGWNIDGVVEPLANLADSVQKWNGINLTGIGANLTNLANGLSALGELGVKKLASEFEGASDRIATSVRTMLDSITSNVNRTKPEILNSFTTLVNDIVKAIGNKNTDFGKAGENTLAYFINGITKKASAVIAAFTQMMSKAVTEVRNKYNDLKSAGSYVVDGLAKGIQENQRKAVAQARAMAKAVEEAAKAELGIRSPSTVFYAVAGYVIQGFANGIEDNIPKVEDSGKEVGTSLIESVRDTLKIDESSSELAKKTIGETFVNGIAEGITEDMSAEEAAAKKAENIATAFQNAMEKIDLSEETSNLEQSLRETMNENSSGEAAKNAVKLEGLTKEYEHQTQRLELVKAEYQATVETFGKASQNAQEAYNEILQQQITLSDLANQISDLKEEELNRQQELNDKKSDLLEQEYSIWKAQNESILDEAGSSLADLALLTTKYEAQTEATNRAQGKYFEAMSSFGASSSEALEAYSTYMDSYETLAELSNDLMEAQKAQLEYDVEAFNKYKVFLAANQRRLLEEGYSAAEIHQKALSASGYDLDSMVDKMREQVHSAVISSMSTVQTAYTETADRTFGSLISNFTEYGEEYATALGKGIQNGSDEVAKSATSMVEDAAGTMAPEQDGFAQLGASAVTSFVTGIQSNLGAITEGSNLMLQTLMDGLANAMSGGIQMDGTVAQIDSSQPEFTMAGEGLMSKLSEGISLMFEPFTNTIMTAINNALLQFQENYLNFNLTGQTVMLNFMEGVTSEEESLLSTFRAIISRSRTMIRNYRSNFVSAGEYLAQGLAVGIRNDESSVIQAAIDICVAAIRAAYATLGVNSPSKEFAKIGMYVDLGFAKGLRDYAGEAENASSELGHSAMNSLMRTISRISDAINGDLDVQPTIRPVLDLSAVEAGASRLNTLFSQQQATAISARVVQNGVDEASIGATTPTAGASFQFVQNNYSPKALSRVEIYRQTNNQFSKFERMVKT